MELFRLYKAINFIKKWGKKFVIPYFHFFFNCSTAHAFYCCAQHLVFQYLIITSINFQKCSNHYFIATNFQMESNQEDLLILNAQTLRTVIFRFTELRSSTSLDKRQLLGNFKALSENNSEFLKNCSTRGS